MDSDLLEIVVSIVLAVVFAIGAHFWGKKRRKEMRALAMEMGLSFRPRPRRDMHHRFRHNVFRRGRSRMAFNTITGVRAMAGHEVTIRMGDYRYVTGSGKNRSTHRLSYAIFTLPWVNTPGLLIRKEHIGDKLAGAIGFDDIDFESEEFSREFCVKSDDKRYAYDVVHPRMMRYLDVVTPPSLEIVGDACLLREGWGYWSVDTFRKMPTWFENFLELWPEHLTETLETRRGA
jgi:hypothetical protein